MDNINTKLNILNDILDKKREILECIYNITENQEQICKISKNAESKNMLNDITYEKQNMIDKIIEIDKIFISIFDSFKDELNKNRYIYMDKILILQNKIRAVADIDIKIRVKEQRNKNLFSINTYNKKIKTLKASKDYIIKKYAENTKKKGKI